MLQLCLLRAAQNYSVWSLGVLNPCIWPISDCFPGCDVYCSGIYWIASHSALIMHTGTLQEQWQINNQGQCITCLLEYANDMQSDKLLHVRFVTWTGVHLMQSFWPGKWISKIALTFKHVVKNNLAWLPQVIKFSLFVDNWINIVYSRQTH